MRVYTSQSDPLDFCSRHAPSEATARARYSQLGDGPDGRGNCFGWDADHPDYSDDAMYVCETCHCRLGDMD